MAKQKAMIITGNIKTNLELKQTNVNPVRFILAWRPHREMHIARRGMSGDNLRQ